MRKDKRYFIGITLCIAVYCWACIWSSSPGRIDDILRSGSYSFSAYSCGCFGCDTNVINVKRTGSKFEASRTHTEYNDDGRPRLTTEPITWDKDKEQSLQNMMHKAVNRAHTGWCTTTSVFVLYKSLYAVKANDDACTFSEQFGNLLK